MSENFSANRQDFPEVILFLSIKVKFSYCAYNSVPNILVQKEQGPEMQYKLMCHPLAPFPAVPERKWVLFPEISRAGDVWGAMPSAACLMGLMHLVSPARSRDQWSLRPPRLLPSTRHESFWDSPALLAANPAPGVGIQLLQSLLVSSSAETVAKWQNLLQAGLADGADVLCSL